MNPQTGKSSECLDEEGKCIFGGPKNHFTSVEAARVGYAAQMATIYTIHLDKVRAGDSISLVNGFGKLILDREVFVANQGRSISLSQSSESTSTIRSLVNNGWRIFKKSSESHR